MGRVSPVDVAGRDLGADQLRGVNRQLGPVVGEPFDPGHVTGMRGIEDDDLPSTAAWVGGIRRGLTVESQVGVGHLDHPVRFARNHELVVGDPDEESLTAPSQREEEPIRGRAGVGTDRDRPFERRHRVAKRIDRIGARLDRPGDDRRNDLGVRGDLRRDLEAMQAHQLLVVVDVAVERGGGVDTAEALDLGVVERIRVRFRDDPDTRPPGMRQHHQSCTVSLERGVKELVFGDRGTQRGNVVTKFTDLRGRFVDETERTAGDPDGPRPAKWVRPQRQAGIIVANPMAADDDLDSGRIPAADLQPVERRERDLHRVETFDGGPARAIACEIGNRVGGPQPVATDRPEAILDCHQRPVDVLVGSRVHDIGVECDLERRHPIGGDLHRLGDRDPTGRIPDQGLHPGWTAQRPIDGPERAGRGAEFVQLRAPRVEGGLEQDRSRGKVGDERREIRDRSVVGAAEHRHDAAHETAHPTGRIGPPCPGPISRARRRARP